jgi:hypothetical protein
MVDALAGVHEDATTGRPFDYLAFLHGDSGDVPAHVAFRFPLTDLPEHPFPTGLPLFCFPSPYRYAPDPPTYFTFVATGSTAEVTCCTVLLFHESPTAPRALCLLGRWPFFGAGGAALGALLRLASSPPLAHAAARVARAAAALLQCLPLPPAGRLVVRGAIGPVQLVLRRPAPNRRLSPLHVRRGLRLLAAALPADALLAAWGALLLERQVVVACSALSALAPCTFALQACCYPFKWRHTFVPVLPAPLMPVLESPLPFLVGLPAELLFPVRAPLPAAGSVGGSAGTPACGRWRAPSTWGPGAACSGGGGDGSDVGQPAPLLPPGVVLVDLDKGTVSVPGGEGGGVDLALPLLCARAGAKLRGALDAMGLGRGLGADKAALWRLDRAFSGSYGVAGEGVFAASEEEEAGEAEEEYGDERGGDVGSRTAKEEEDDDEGEKGGGERTGRVGHGPTDPLPADATAARGGAPLCSALRRAFFRFFVATLAPALPLLEEAACCARDGGAGAYVAAALLAGGVAPAEAPFWAELFNTQAWAEFCDSFVGAGGADAAASSPPLLARASTLSALLHSPAKVLEGVDRAFFVEAVAAKRARSKLGGLRGWGAPAATPFLTSRAWAHRWVHRVPPLGADCGAPKTAEGADSEGGGGGGAPAGGGAGGCAGGAPGAPFFVFPALSPSLFPPPRAPPGTVSHGVSPPLPYPQGVPPPDAAAARAAARVAAKKRRAATAPPAPAPRGAPAGAGDQSLPAVTLEVFFVALLETAHVVAAKRGAVWGDCGGGGGSGGGGSGGASGGGEPGEGGALAVYRGALCCALAAREVSVARRRRLNENALRALLALACAAGAYETALDALLDMSGSGFAVGAPLHRTVLASAFDCAQGEAARSVVRALLEGLSGGSCSGAGAQRPRSPAGPGGAQRPRSPAGPPPQLPAAASQSPGSGGFAAPRGAAPRKGSVAAALAANAAPAAACHAASPPRGGSVAAVQAGSGGGGGGGAPPRAPPPPVPTPPPVAVAWSSLNLDLECNVCPACGTHVPSAGVRGGWSPTSPFEYGVPCPTCPPLPPLAPGGAPRAPRFTPHLGLPPPLPPRVTWLPPLVMRREVAFLAAARGARGAESRAWAGAGVWGGGLAGAAPSLLCSMLAAFRDLGLPCEWLQHLV